MEWADALIWSAVLKNPARVDGLCRVFRLRGAHIVENPADEPWGNRQFTLDDLNAHIFYYFRFSDGVK